LLQSVNLSSEELVAATKDMEKKYASVKQANG